MTFERSFDYEMLRKIVVSDPRLYDAMGDDWSPRIEEYEGPPRSHQVVYVTAELGFFMFIPKNHICWEMHTVMHLYGARAIAAMKGVIQWVFENTECRRIITTVPESNGIALRFAKRVGLKQFGRNEKSFQKGGVIQDEIWLGVSA